MSYASRSCQLAAGQTDVTEGNSASSSDVADLMRRDRLDVYE